MRDFEDMLIFYQPTGDGIEIVRVLKAERDWWTLLGLACGAVKLVNPPCQSSLSILP